MASRWSDFEKDFIRAHAAVMKDEELAARLTSLTRRVITIHAVRHARARLGLRKQHGRGRCELAPVQPGNTLGLRLVGG